MSTRITSQPFSAREVIDALRVCSRLSGESARAPRVTSAASTAARLGCSASRVSQYVDAHHDATIRIHEAAALPPVAAVAIAEFVVGPAYLVVEAPSASEDLGDDMRHAIEAHRESNEAVGEALAACADGHITAEEGARLEREGLEAVRALLRLVELGRRAQRERVIAARRLAVAR